MYVARNASYYSKFPEAKLEPPPEGPGSGILVIQDEEFRKQEMTSCFGLFYDSQLKKLPFPQNQSLSLEYTIRIPWIEEFQKVTAHDYAYFIPVLGKPVSLNQYYVVLAKGRRRGQVSTCSKKEDSIPCCFFRCIFDAKPTKFALDDKNIYQQVEVIPKLRRGKFRAKSVTSDGLAQSFLRRRVIGWRIHASSKSNCRIGEALGITRSSQEPLVSTQHSSSSPVIVGKWYCPFIFVSEEGVQVKEQVDRNVYYEMTLQQYWEEIYEGDGGGTVEVNVSVQNPKTLLFGDKEVDGTNSVVDGVMWFRTLNPNIGKNLFGLNTLIVERMTWEQRRRGWVESDRVEKMVDKCGNKFWLHVLVERFVLRRIKDRSVVFSCAFKHTNKVRSTWD